MEYTGFTYNGLLMYAKRYGHTLVFNQDHTEVGMEVKRHNFMYWFKFHEGMPVVNPMYFLRAERLDSNRFTTNGVVVYFIYKFLIDYTLPSDCGVVHWLYEDDFRKSLTL